MGQTLKRYFTPIQRRFLNEIGKDTYITQAFYLTGGTALAACYLNHRLSEDIDLFSEAPFDESLIIASMKKITKQLAAKSTLTKIHGRLRYDLALPNNELLKIDFVFYDFKHIESTNQLGTLVVDSIEDIAVNKLLAISQRTASKDYVDLYFILKKYTVWDLRHGVERKFKMEIEPFYLSSLFAKAEELQELPIMKKKLTLDQLKRFFLKEAKRLALTMVKP